MIETLTETAESPVADRLFRKMCSMECILVPKITADRLNQFVIIEIVVFLQYQCPNNEIHRSIWPGKFIIAVKDRKTFFIDSRKNNICKIPAPGIHDDFLRARCLIYKAVIQRNLLILIGVKRHILYLTPDMSLL